MRTQPWPTAVLSVPKTLFSRQLWTPACAEDDAASQATRTAEFNGPTVWNTQFQRLWNIRQFTGDAPVDCRTEATVDWLWCDFTVIQLLTSLTYVLEVNVMHGEPHYRVALCCDTQPLVCLYLISAPAGEILFCLCVAVNLCVCLLVCYQTHCIWFMQGNYSATSNNIGWYTGRWRLSY